MPSHRRRLADIQFGVGEVEEDLWGAVAACLHIHGHHACIGGFNAPGHAEVEDLDIALAVNGDIRRLQVSVDDVRAVEVLEPCLYDAERSSMKARTLSPRSSWYMMYWMCGSCSVPDWIDWSRLPCAISIVRYRSW